MDGISMASPVQMVMLMKRESKIWTDGTVTHACILRLAVEIECLRNRTHIQGVSIYGKYRIRK